MVDAFGVEVNLFEGEDTVEIGNDDPVDAPFAAGGYTVDWIANRKESLADNIAEGAMDRRVHYSVQNGRMNRVLLNRSNAVAFRRFSRFLGPLGAIGQYVYDINQCGCKK